MYSQIIRARGLSERLGLGHAKTECASNRQNLLGYITRLAEWFGSEGYLRHSPLLTLFSEL